VTGFINLKIKPTQSFRDAHKDIVYMNIYICIVFLKKKHEDWIPKCVPKISIIVLRSQ
jgi:hypothetical protein